MIFLQFSPSSQAFHSQSSNCRLPRILTKGQSWRAVRYNNNNLFIGMNIGGRPHRRLKLSAGDIYLDSRKAKFQPIHPIHKTQASDPFLSYKESYQLPAFKSVDRTDTIDIKRRLRSLESRPNRYKLQSKLRSHSIVGDDIESHLIRRELCSMEIGDSNDSALKNHLDHKYLTEFEKVEIRKYKDIYYIGHKAHLRKYKDNFRDKEDNYKPLIGDHIAYRFQIIKILGSGAFGKVLEVLDHKYNRHYALKILKVSDQLYQQFKLEIKILKVVKQHHSTNKNIVEIKGDFQFRGHICIVTQMLSMNVYAYIKAQNYEGFELDIVRKILIQLMQALLFLHKKNIIHCDIKPENVVFKELGKSGVKLIDFGSACFFDQKEFTYIQSRYYRSPEIVLMKPYDHKIDIWSLGCLIFQIYTGSPLFPSRTEEEQMQMLLTTLGAPPAHFLQKCERSQEFDFSNFQGKSPRAPLKDRLKGAPASMLRLVEWMVRWSPEQRPTIEQCLMHEFILQGLPKMVREEHIRQMTGPNPYGLY